MLGELGDAKAVPHLIPFLEHSDGDVRSYAVTALAELKSDVAIPYLIQNLKNEDPSKRSQAIASLKKLTGLDFGYHSESPVEDRDKSILKWERWIKTNQSPRQNS